MEYIMGVAVALAVVIFARLTGFDRDRAFYPTALIVTASYYVLFAVMGGTQAIIAEMVAMALFVAAAVMGFRTHIWIVAAAFLAHGAFDLVHGHVIANPGTPGWWPMFCLSLDVAVAAYLLAFASRSPRAKLAT